MTDLASLRESIANTLGSAVVGDVMARGELTFEVQPAAIREVMTHLRDVGEFKILVDVCGVDWPQRAKRFDVVYHLLSMTKNARLRIKAQVASPLLRGCDLSKPSNETLGMRTSVFSSSRYSAAWASW